MIAIDARNKLIRYTRKLNTTLANACRQVLDHPRFLWQVGSAGEHHAYAGGLAIHTLEVVEFACQMREMFTQANEQILIVAAIFHDFLKVDGYDLLITGVDSPIVINLSRSKILAGSVAEFLKSVSEQNLPEAIVLGIQHAILAHNNIHECATPESFILYMAHLASVRFGAIGQDVQQPLHLSEQELYQQCRQS